MILSISLNPSLDTSIYLDNFSVGALNRIDNKTDSFAGKGVNVAVALKRLGEDAQLAGFNFIEDDGMQQKRLTMECVPFNLIPCAGKLRNNIKIITPDSLTELNDKSTPVSDQNRNDFIALYKELVKKASVVVFSGSLPQGLSENFYLELIKLLPAGVRFVIDCERKQLIDSLPDKPLLIKPNKFELESALGIHLNTIEDIISAAKTMCVKGAENVIVSLGAEGAIITNSVETYVAASPEVDAVSSVGAGDSMVAAAICELRKGSPLDEVIRNAVAAGTAAVMSEGTNLFKMRDVEMLLPLIKIKKV